VNWEDVSEKSHEVMKELGSFSPTNSPQNREVKGYTLDPDGDAGKTYWGSSDLREIAAACVEVADWLDKRAEEPA
jgi:hypothetical protein